MQPHSCMFLAENRLSGSTRSCRQLELLEDEKCLRAELKHGGGIIVNNWVWVKWYDPTLHIVLSNIAVARNWPGAASSYPESVHSVLHCFGEDCTRYHSLIRIENR